VLGIVARILQAYGQFLRVAGRYGIDSFLVVKRHSCIWCSVVLALVVCWSCLWVWIQLVLTVSLQWFRWSGYDPPSAAHQLSYPSTSMDRDMQQTTASEGHQPIMSLESMETKSHELGAAEAEAKRTSQCGTTHRSTSSSVRLSSNHSLVVVAVVAAVAQQQRELDSGGPLRAVLPHLIV
jgi:hypothetical protein